MFKCEFCNNDYSTKSNLHIHQKTAKKCISLRGVEMKDTIFKCDKCDYTTMRKSNFTSHINSCKAKLRQKYSILEENNIELTNKNQVLVQENKKIVEENQVLVRENKKIVEENKKITDDRQKLFDENKKLQEQIQEYKNMMFQLASKPTSVNTTNNNTNTTNTINKTENLVVFDWSQDNIKKKVEDNFTLKHLEGGIKGVAKFTYDHIITQSDGKKSLICSDPARMMFKYKDTDGVIQKDVRATKLKNAVKDPIINKSKTLFIEENTRLFDEVKRGKDDDENNEVMLGQITILKDNFLKVKNIDDNLVEYAKEISSLVN